ncbi:MAG: beta-N-acetylglucosaminidase domain-containing protein [Acidimicrobiales bacterium]
MTGTINGIIEGFYGTPWSWEERSSLASWCGARGLAHYVYAPKDDPLHRERWAEPYGADTLAAFAGLVEDGGLEVGFALSPGLSIDYGAADDRAALAAKVDQVLDIGVRLIVLALDDIPVRPGLGPQHASLTTWLADHVRERSDGALVLVPTEYTGTASTPYLDALAEGVPDDVPIAWTGPTVVCDEVTADQAAARAAALGDRRPLLWDNDPVNDTVMADRLFLGPLRGRDAALRGELGGYLANPMVQATANRLPLASTAAWWRGVDPYEVWSSEAEALGWRTFAEACDGEVPRRLVAEAIADPAGALDPLEAWLHAASTCTAPGLEVEAAAWLDQVHVEASAGLVAVAAARLGLAGDRTDAVIGQVMALSVLWPQARRSACTVLGPRCSFRPVLSQWSDGGWRFHAASAQIDDNALDALAAWAIEVCGV